jgi:hypothetical protein
VGGVSRGIDRVEVTFDEPNLVANAGLSRFSPAGSSTRRSSTSQQRSAGSEDRVGADGVHHPGAGEGQRAGGCPSRV